MTEKKYIDASAWLERCNKSYMHYNLAKKIIDEAPAAPVFGQWIDAAEQLPAEADEYIVMIAGAAKSTVLHYDVNDEGESVWFEEVEDSTNFYKVTHWMALPEGPKEERIVPLNGANKATRPTSSTTFGGWTTASGPPSPTGEGYEGAVPYKNANVCKCRSCGAEIVFVMMKSGAKMPCDAVPIRCREDKSAKTSFVRPDGVVMRGVETPDGVADFMGYRSHFETCPQADQFRKRGQGDA